MAQNDNPLSAGQIRDLQADEAELGRIHAMIVKAAEAGIDQRSERAACEVMMARVRQLLDVYGGRRKTR